MKPYFSFQWHITDDCDQRCRHCYIYSGDQSKKPDAMRFSQMEKTLENCMDFCRTFGRRPYFYITGGDPILHPDFWNLLDRLYQRKIPFSILGNPFHLDDSVCRDLTERGCQKYQLSLDGLRETHDWFRKPGSFDQTLEKVACINRSGMKSVIMTTVSKENADEMTGIIDTAVRAGADVFSFARYVPSGGELDAGLTPSEYRTLLEACDARFRYWEEKGVSTRFNKKDHLWTLYDYETGAFRIPQGARDGVIYSGCNCGNCHLTILPTGEVFACRRVAQSRVANALTDRLADVWLREMEDYRVYTRFEKCARCRLLPYCRGCPAVAKGTSGDFYAKDPQCWADEQGELFESSTMRAR